MNNRVKECRECGEWEMTYRFEEELWKCRSCNAEALCGMV